MATYAAPIPQVHAHHVEHESTGWTSWLTTTDHKKIGIMYMVLTFMFFCLGGDLQPAVHDARHDDGLPVRGTDDGGPGQLLPAVDDRRARHGLPAFERAVLLAAARRRHRLLRVDLLEPAGSGLDELPAALERALLAL